MRARVSVVLLAACCTLAAAPLCAQSAETTTANSATEARRHFRLGIRLYQDTNYPGALAEFEAAYAAKPSPSSLQNVALCQKALFRYREAAATLTQLLDTQGSELSEGERKAVADAITELDGLVGSIVVTVEPSDAKVTLDGRVMAASELRAGVDVNVGEHEVVADEPGYARLVRVVSVASGQKLLPVELKLEATDGFLNIVASDPLAAIAVDGTTRAFHDWRGSVKPDTEHLVQVFRDGYESYEATVTVALGQTLDIHAALGARVEGDAPITPIKPDALPPPPPARVPKGYYGLLTLDVLGLGKRALSFTSSRSSDAMGSLGIRAGYRLWAPIAAELMLDFGKLKVTDATTSDDTNTKRSYSLNAVRFGPNLRLMTSGKVFRFSSAIGAGVVHHKLSLDPVSDQIAMYPGGSASGYDPYFLLELGVQWSIGRLLLGAEIVTLIDGATGLNQESVENSKAFGSTNTLPLFGLGIHGGYALW